MTDDDPFEGLTLDEDFVRGATRREPSARMRARQSPPPIAMPPKRRPPRRRPRWLVAVLVGAVVGGSIAAVTIGHHGSGSPTLIGGAPQTSPTAAAARTRALRHHTSLADQYYTPGQCYRWRAGVEYQVAKQLPCSQPHIFEAVDDTSLIGQYGASAGYPTPQQWNVITTSVCGPPTERFLGWTLDPQGPYSDGLIRPTRTGWTLQGDRKVVCGIQAQPVLAFGHPIPAFTIFSGAVTRASDVRTWPAGTCLRLADHYRYDETISCKRGHEFEITGASTLANINGSVTQAALDSTAQSACSSVTVAFLHNRVPTGGVENTLGLALASYEAGTRTAECIVEYGQPGRWILHHGAA